MRKLIIWYGVLLIVGHLFTEVHSVLNAFYPKSATIKLDLFWSPSFKMDISILWFIYTIGNDLNVIITYFVLTNIAYRFSSALFFISSVFFLYHVIDIFLFCWNYKRTASVYWILLAAVIVSTIFLIIKKKIHKTSIISIE